MKSLKSQKYAVSSAVWFSLLPGTSADPVGSAVEHMASLEEQVGALVRHHRKRLGLTQAQLAERIDRQTGAITRIETGEAAPSFETLASLATALQVDVRDFFGAGSYAAADREDPLVTIISRLSGLEPDDLSAVDELIAAGLKLKRTR